MCPSSLQVDTIACVHIEIMPSNYTCVQTATAGRLHLFHGQGNGKTCWRPEGYHGPDSFGKHSYPMQACEMQIPSYGTESPRAEPIEAESGVVLVIGADL